jgi:hypothetical protein
MTVPGQPSLWEAVPRGGGWLPRGFHLETHRHADGQLVYAAAGALATTTERGTWVAPANRVTWTPPGFAHSHRFYGRTDVRLLAIPAGLCGELVAYPSVFAASPLLREALLTLTDRPETRPGAYDRLRAVVIDELAGTPSSPCTSPNRATTGCVLSPRSCIPTQLGPQR